VLYEGRTQRIYAYRDIFVGQEITICYLDPIVSKARRAEVLMDKYWFECGCSRCLGIEIEGGMFMFLMLDGFSIIDQLFLDGSQVIGLSRHLHGAPIKPIQGDVDASDVFMDDLLGFSRPVLRGVLFSKAATDNDYSDRRYQAIKRTYTAPSFRPSMELFAKIAAYQREAVEAGNWGYVVESALFVLAVYVLVYERHHPLIGQQFLLLAKAVWNRGCVDGGDISELGVIFRAARDCLSVGKHEKAFGELDELWRALEE
jgi:hypothetical protein